MAKEDFAQSAHDIFKQSIGEKPKGGRPREKDPAAVSLGRKGGKARAEKLSKAERRKIAREAAKARWDKERQPNP
ncbi:hypothetical protein IIA79_02050 [bacterium]|nr:hypothetical protein [bacterium]